MKYFKFFIILLIVFPISSIFAQTAAKTAKNTSVESANFFKSTPAFAEAILRKTELQSEMESLLVSYTEEFPKVQELKYELSALNTETQRIAAVKAADISKLTLALGKLIVRKAELETDFWSLQKKYGDDHPDVKRAKRKVEIYENSIKEILD